jgi:drug/metabolite transporter (DMT)-like permease
MGELALALGASVAWGASDFLAGVASRRLAVLSVLVGSQAVGLVIAAVAVAAQGAPPPGAGFVAWAALAGLAEAAGFACLYRGLAVGAMAIVAPITATAAAVPLAVGLAGGDALGAPALAGAALAVAGVLIAAREPGSGRRLGTGVALGVGAAACFGLFLVGLDVAGSADALWTTVIVRVASLGALGAVLVARRRPVGLGRGDVRLLVGIGALDVVANGCFAFAAAGGALSVVGVLGSLYPVTTVLLAAFVLHEKLPRGRQAGVVACLAGAALLGASG